MNSELYYQLVRYLANGEIPQNIDKQRKNTIIRSRRNFEFDQYTQQLYKISGQEQKQVVSEHQKQ